MAEALKPLPAAPDPSERVIYRGKPVSPSYPFEYLNESGELDVARFSGVLEARRRGLPVAFVAEPISTAPGLHRAMLNYALEWEERQRRHDAAVNAQGAAEYAARQDAMQRKVAEDEKARDAFEEGRLEKKRLRAETTVRRFGGQP